MLKEKPVLQELLDLEILSSVDLFFAKTCLKGTALENETLFLAYLFLVTRLGHHCISFNDQSFSPNIVPEQSIDKSHLLKCLKKGASNLADDIVQNANGKICLKPVVKFNQRFYLQKSYFLESKLISKIQELLGSQKKAFSKEEIAKSADVYVDKLHSGQLESIKQTLQKPFSLLTGGPGTGKTYTAAYLLKVFEKLCLEKKITSKIAVAAPTGKAAMRLKQSLSMAGFEKQIKASTLHQLLDIRKRSELFSNQPKLPFDLILVDESSMIDLELFTVLVSRVKESSFLVLLGDPHQLPPVESGTVFAELALSKDQSVLPVSCLEKCVRVENEDLIDLANIVLSKKKIDIDTLKESSCINVYEAKRTKNMLAYVENQVSNLLRHTVFSPLKEGFELEDLFSSMSSHKLLSPLNQGAWGVEAINKRCLNVQLSRTKNLDQCAIPIIITKNDYDLDLYNGTEGIYIKHIDTDPRREIDKDYVVFRNEDGFVKWPLSSLKSYELAYCLSVHKSQGSEYEKVSLLLNRNSECFGLEMLYTAITRAKKELDLLLFDFSFDRVYKHNSLKVTGLSKRLFGQNP